MGIKSWLRRLWRPAPEPRERRISRLADRLKVGPIAHAHGIGLKIELSARIAERMNVCLFVWVEDLREWRPHWDDQGDLMSSLGQDGTDAGQEVARAIVDKAILRHFSESALAGVRDALEQRERESSQ